MARLLEEYEKNVAPRLKEQFKIANPMSVPRLEKIVISMGVGALAKEKTKLAELQEQLSRIAGQKALIMNAKKSVSNFNLRAGMPVGLKVTLRRAKMYEFLDRLISIVIPRVRDFRGLNPSAFDGRGNYNMGLSEQSVFPEIDPAAMTLVHGMNISMQSSTDDDEQSRALLKMLGMPFKENES